MFTIAPIGSCRIATPLRRNRDRYGFALSFGRNYGFCHSSAEAVQQLRFLRGEIEIDENVWPLVARGKDRATITGTDPEDADLYIVELSSAKRIMLGATCVQLNYLNNEFRDFFGEKARARQFWDLCLKDDQTKIDTYLATAWSSDNDMRAQSRILRQLRMSFTTEDALRRDVRHLIEHTPDVLFITHVNATDIAGQPIPSRSEFIDLVTKVVGEEGAKLYNPTDRMHEMGQTRAIEDYSDSLAHFTSDFSDLVFADWYDLAIAPAIDDRIKRDGKSAVETVLRPNVEALIANGNTRPLPDRLAALARSLGHLPALSLLQATVEVANDTQDLAYQRLLAAHQTDPDDLTILGELADLAFEAGDADCALECLQKLHALGQPIDSDDLVTKGQALMAQDNVALGFGYLELALKDGPVTGPLARSYVSAALEKEPNRLAALDGTLAAQFHDHLPADAALALSVQRGTRAVSDIEATIRQSLPDIDAGQLYAALRQIEPLVGFVFCAEVVKLWRDGQKDSTRLMDKSLRELVSQWYIAAYDLQAPVAAQIPVLEAILGAYPLHRDARIAIREQRAKLTEAARDRYKAGDLDGLQRVATDAAHLTEPLADLSIFQARLALANGMLADAVTFARSALRDDPDHPVAWITLMRAAFQAEDYITTDRAAAHILSASDSDMPRWQDEAAARYDRLPALAMRAAREQTDPLITHDLLQIAARDPRFADAAAARTRKLEAALAQELREFGQEATDEAAFLARANQIMAVVRSEPHVERATVAVGRFLVKHKNFEAALPFWKNASSFDPDNENYQFQHQRCLEKIGAGQHQTAARPIAGS